MHFSKTIELQFEKKQKETPYIALYFTAQFRAIIA